MATILGQSRVKSTITNHSWLYQSTLTLAISYSFQPLKSWGVVGCATKKRFITLLYKNFFEKASRWTGRASSYFKTSEKINKNDKTKEIKFNTF